MTSTVKREITKTIQTKRRQLELIRQEVEDLLDYLGVIEARARDRDKPRLTCAEVKKRFGLRETMR